MCKKYITIVFINLNIKYNAEYLEMKQPHIKTNVLNKQTDKQTNK